MLFFLYISWAEPPFLNVIITLSVFGDALIHFKNTINVHAHTEYITIYDGTLYEAVDV